MVKTWARVLHFQRHAGRGPGVWGHKVRHGESPELHCIFMEPGWSPVSVIGRYFLYTLSLDSFILSQGFSLQLDSHLQIQLRFFFFPWGLDISLATSCLCLYILEVSRTLHDSCWINHLCPSSSDHSHSFILDLHWGCPSPIDQTRILNFLYALLLLHLVHFSFPSFPKLPVSRSCWYCNCL